MMDDNYLKAIQKNKREWSRGEWDDEKDFDFWTDESSGYECGIIRNSTLGHLCGYVAFPLTHPQANKEIFDICTCSDWNQVITFSDFSPKFGKDKWTFGFDNAHLWDTSPREPWGRDVTGSYKSWEWTKRLVIELAGYLKEEESNVQK